MRLRATCICFAALLVAAATAPAQFGLFASGTAQNVGSSTWLYGPTAGLYSEFYLPIVSLGGDLRGSYLSGGNLHHWNGGLGPRVSVHLPGIAYHPYGEYLVGVGGYRTDPSNTTTTHIDYQAVVGVEKKLIPLIDWRIVEFNTSNYYNSGASSYKTLSTGLVLRIP